MPNEALKTERLREEIRISLGSSAIDVELADKDIDVSVRQALRFYNRYQPRYAKKRIPVTKAQKKYRVDDTIPGLISVIDVEFIARAVEPTAVDAFNPYITSIGGPYFGDETIGDVVQRRMYMEDSERVISSESEWYFQWEPNSGGTAMQAFLYIDVVLDNVDCGFTYIVRYEDSDDVTKGRQAIPEADTDWIVNYATAKASLILARIMGKYGGVQNSDGSTEPTDADNLRQQAVEDVRRLEEEMQQRRRPGLPLTE